MISVLKRSVQLYVAEQMINKIYPFAVFAFDRLSAVFADVHACPPHCCAMALAMPGKVLERSLALLPVAISTKLYALPVLLLYPSGFGAGILQSYSSIGNPLSQKQVLFL